MAIQQINVSQLRNACIDAEWRKKWINGENPPTMLFSSNFSNPVHGSIFHKIAEEYVNWLISPKNKKIALKLNNQDELWHEMYERFAEKKFNQLLRNRHIESSYHLAKCLRVFCLRILELKKRTKNFQSWEDIYLTKEFLIQDVRFNIGSSNIFISGQIDAVRTHPEYGLEIVDYKLSHGTNMKHDMAQLAIYAKLISIVKPGLKFYAILEYYEPELNEVAFTRKELESIFKEIVEPVLYEIAGESKGNIEILDTHEFKGEDLSANIEECYKSFKLSVEIIDKIEAPQLIRYMVKPLSGVKFVSLANRAEDLQVALSLTQIPLIAPGQGFVTIDIPKEKPDIVFLRNIVNKSAYLEHKGYVSFPVGVSVDNQIIMADLADPNMCHALVAGASGSGKSEFLKSLVASLIYKNTPQTLKISLIDPKILTFGSFSNCPHLASPIITDIFSAIPFFQTLIEEMDDRYRQLAKEGFENLSERFNAGKIDIPFYIIIFDEFADLILAGKEEKKEFETMIVRLAAKGRASGIHLVLTTQRPDSKIVTGLIKANLPLKICFRVISATNSQIVLDQSGGETLLGRGDMLCDRGKGIERAQSPYISHDDLFKMATS
ncbi:MAG: PD-(D/E)XK nuclease family protein [Desulfobacterales bacterium]|nr:PD-(D/E)XK nuclease family protein [Desulfobacterales bacterium]